MEHSAQKTMVMVTHRVPGFHYWPGAPDEVSYLAHRHRHLFMVIVSVTVGHDNREVEFHTLQGDVRSQFSDNMDFGARSCEMIAKDLIGKLEASGYRVAWAEVWEDGENGARVEVKA
jgi:hypothetical protein